MASEDPTDLGAPAETEPGTSPLSPAPVLGVPSVPGPEPERAPPDHGGRARREHSGLRSVARGFSWATAGQLISAGGNLALTPFVIHGLGLERYGLFAFTSTVLGFLSTFASGLNGTAARYFPFYAGRDDRVATTRMFITLLVFILCLGGVLAVIDWFVSPLVVDALSMQPKLRPEAIFLFRTLCLLVTFTAAHGLVQLVIMARKQYARPVQVGLVCYLMWVVGVVWVVHHHEGLRGIAVIFVLQQVVATAGVAPLTVRYLSREGISLLPWKEMRELFSFAARLQVSGAANLVNQQLNSLVIGGALSVRAVGFYNVGANFYDQITYVAAGVVTPTQVQLGNTLGAEGEDVVYAQYRRVQRPWAQAATGLCAVAMGASYFGVRAWLGSGYNLASWTAVVLLASAPPVLFALLLNAYVTVRKKPGLEMRYGLFAMSANVILTAGLVVFGVIGVVAASVVSNSLSALFLIRLVRRNLHPDLPNFFRYMPVVRATMAGVATVLMELALRPFLPASGPIALLECAVPGLVGLGFYAVLVIGPVKVVRLAASTVRTRRLPTLAALLAGF